MISLMLWLGMMCSELETEYFTTSEPEAGAEHMGPVMATGAERERKKGLENESYIKCICFNCWTSLVLNTQLYDCMQ